MFEVENPEECRGQASRAHPEQRGPGAHDPRGAQHQAHDDDDRHRGDRGCRGSRGRLRHPREHGEPHGHHRDRDERQERAGCERCDQAPEVRQIGRQDELTQRRRDHQGPEQGWSARDQRDDRYPDRGPGSTHDGQTSATDRAKPDRLHDRNQSADHHAGEDRPRQVHVALVRDPRDDRIDHDHRHTHQNRRLRPDDERHQAGRAFVSGVAQSASGLPRLRCHTAHNTLSAFGGHAYPYGTIPYQPSWPTRRHHLQQQLDDGLVPAAAQRP